MRKPSPEEPVSALRAIPIEENGDPLVPLLEAAPEIRWSPVHPVFEYERLAYARRSVAEMLAKAARSLPAGIRLAVVEAYRHPEIQRSMHQETRRRMREEHPDWSPQYLGRMANRFSAPMDARVPPPHTTGGAVDVHLVDDEGRPLDFQSPYTMLDTAAAPAFVKGLSETARRNRAHLREAMGGAGFTNYPSEWWHWSYGDQAWAYRGGHPHALFAAIEPEGLASTQFEFRRKEQPGFE